MDQSELQMELIEEDEVAEKVEEVDENEKKGLVDPSDPKEIEHAASKTLSPSTAANDTPGGTSSSTRAPSPANATDASTKGKLVEEEQRQTGRVKFSVYSLYLRSAGYTTWLLILLLILAGRVFRVADRW